MPQYTEGQEVVFLWPIPLAKEGNGKGACFSLVRHYPVRGKVKWVSADGIMVVDRDRRELEWPLSFEEAKLYMAPARGDVVHVG